MIAANRFRLIAVAYGEDNLSRHRLLGLVEVGHDIDAARAAH